MSEPTLLNDDREHDLTMHVFSISASMVGICLTAISLIRLISTNTNITSIGEELLAGNALMFMSCCFLSFWSFKTSIPERRQTLRQLIDGIFMLALAFMVAVCGLIAYEFI